MTTKELIVVSVGDLRPSKINEYPYRYIVFKSTDSSDKSKYALNLQKRDDKNYNNWMNALKPGSVIKAVMQERKGNEKNVDQWKQFSVSKIGGKVKEFVAESKEDATKLIVALELKNIYESIKKIEEAIL